MIAAMLKGADADEVMPPWPWCRDSRATLVLVLIMVTMTPVLRRYAFIAGPQ